MEGGRSVQVLAGGYMFGNVSASSPPPPMLPLLWAWMLLAELNFDISKILIYDIWQERQSVESIQNRN